MDNSVKRVTAIEGEGADRDTKVLYQDERDNDPDIPPIERAVRHVVNAALIAAKVAYDSYIDRAKKGKTSWAFQPRDAGSATSTRTRVRQETPAGTVDVGTSSGYTRSDV
jgi:hypothetical protein